MGPVARRGKEYAPGVRDDRMWKRKTNTAVECEVEDEREYQVANWALARTGTIVQLNECLTPYFWPINAQGPPPHKSYCIVRRILPSTVSRADPHTNISSTDLQAILAV